MTLFNYIYIYDSSSCGGALVGFHHSCSLFVVVVITELTMEIPLFPNNEGCMIEINHFTNCTVSNKISVWEFTVIIILVPFLMQVNFKAIYKMHNLELMPPSMLQAPLPTIHSKIGLLEASVVTVLDRWS